MVMQLKFFEIDQFEEKFCAFNSLTHDYWNFNMMHHKGKDRSTSHNFL